MERETVTAHLLPTMIFQHRRDKVPLYVGGGGIGHDSPEPARLRKAGGHDTRAFPAVFDDRLHHPPSAGQAVAQGIGRLDLPARDIVDVVLQVRTDCRFVERDLNPVLLEVFARADAGQHKDLRGVECAG